LYRIIHFVRLWSGQIEKRSKAMKKNMGTTDRVFRGIVTIGAVIVSGIIGFSTVGGIVLLAVAAIMTITAASGFCPLYSVLGIKTTCDTTSGYKGRGFHLHRAS
jgi:hypothetical protein